MSSTQAFTSQAYHGYSSEYDKGPDIIVDLDNTSVFSAAFTATTPKSWVNVNSIGKGKLFPNATAHPTKADITFYAGKRGISSGEIRFYVNGTQIFNQSAGNKNYAYTGRTDAVILNSTKSTEIKWVIAHGTMTGTSIDNINVTYYFTRCDFSASAGANVTSASVSSSTGYDGDTIQYRCTLASGAEWQGWYKDGALYSSTKDLNVTVSGADLALQARATMPVVTKTLSATYNGAQLQGFPKSVQSDVQLAYGGASKGSVPLSGGAKIFRCGGKIANEAIRIGGTTLNNSGKYMATDVAAYITKNLLDTTSFTLSNVSVSGEVYAFKPNVTAMINQALPTPVAGHKYYGRCYQKAPSGSTFLDGRFEYFYTDGANMVFCSMSDTIRDNQWHLHSAILELSTIASASGWILRSSTVSGSAEAYRKEMLIVDLTDMFGAGNEPEKTWCDANL